MPQTEHSSIQPQQCFYHLSYIFFQFKQCLQYKDNI